MVSSGDKPYYLESSEKLRIRIQAHTRFTSLQLEAWLLEQLVACEGKILLEVGCGDGNFFTTYAQALGPSGLIIGWDINEGLLEKARERRTATPAQLQQWDYDQHPFPLAEEAVDIVIAPFSAYYTKDVPAWDADALRILRRGGRMLLLGPTRDNAQELYELNARATGLSSVPETDETSQKLETEFYADLLARQGIEIRKTVLERAIDFPSAEEFARYYFATMLYEKTQERLAAPLSFGKVTDAARAIGLRLNKKVVVLDVRKPAC